MKSDMERLLAEAKCRGDDTNLFSEEHWFRKRISFAKGVAAARDKCDHCPVRWECLKIEMAYEHGLAEAHRALVYAGMTASQRYSLEKRGVALDCPSCGEQFDPIQLRIGDLECAFCSYKAEMEALPDRGDEWVPRHTLLAGAVLTWLIDNVSADDEVPSASKMAKIVNARVNDMRRVYEALQVDQILVRTGDGVLRRQAVAASAKGWTPKHLRVRYSHAPRQINH